VHLDSSSFHLHGQYAIETPDEEMVTITHGYSRDHRPDLKQVVAQIITSHKSNLPVWLEVLSGNSSDKESFAQTVKAYCQHLKGEKQPYFVMDSAGYSEKGLKTLQDMLWLMRVPETLAEAKRLVKETEQSQMAELAPGYFGKEIESEYGGVPQRWLVVSHGLRMSENSKAWQRRRPGRKSCRKVVAQGVPSGFQLSKIQKQPAAVQSTLEIPPGRYRSDLNHQTCSPRAPFCWSRAGCGWICPDRQRQILHAWWEEVKRSLGKFILATNEMDEQNLSAAAENYTAQGISVERGFRFLKDPLFCRQFVPQNPARIMALIMIMGLALLVLPWQSANCAWL
jgi:transposase